MTAMKRFIHLFPFLLLSLIFALPLPVVAATPTPTPEFIPQNGPWEWVKETDEKYWIRSCDFASPTYGWGVGGKNSSYLWDGDKWRIMEYDSQTLSSPDQVVVIDPETIWAFKSWPPRLFKWENHWVAYEYPIQGDFMDASFLNANLGYVVGGENENLDVDATRSILKWSGKEWQEITNFPLSPAGVKRLRSVEAVTENDVWVSDDYQMYHWNGEIWNTYSARQVVNGNRIAMIDYAKLDSQVWAAGLMTQGDLTSGVILRWDGQTWQEEFRSDYENMLQIEMLSPTLGWAIGYKYIQGANQDWKPQFMLFYWDGNTWSEFLQFNEQEYGRLCGFDAEHLWIFQGVMSNSDGGVLRLRRKATATATATSTPAATLTPVPSQTLTPLPSETPTPIPESTGGDLGSVLVAIGVVALIVLLGVVASRRRKVQ
jgi:LPXTG-motif cell wall-anchored protein